MHLRARQRVCSAGAANGGVEVEEQAQIVRAAVNLKVPGAHPARAACSHGAPRLFISISAMADTLIEESETIAFELHAICSVTSLVCSTMQETMAWWVAQRQGTSAFVPHPSHAVACCSTPLPACGAA